MIVDVFIHFCMHSLYGSNPIIMGFNKKKNIVIKFKKF